MRIYLLHNGGVFTVHDTAFFVPELCIVYLTLIRQRSRVVYERIVNEAKPS